MGMFPRFRRFPSSSGFLRFRAPNSSPCTLSLAFLPSLPTTDLFLFSLGRWRPSQIDVFGGGAPFHSVLSAISLGGPPSRCLTDTFLTFDNFCPNSNPPFCYFGRFSDACSLSSPFFFSFFFFLFLILFAPMIASLLNVLQR